jgi:hypothetical protein
MPQSARFSVHFLCRSHFVKGVYTDTRPGLRSELPVNKSLPTSSMRATAVLLPTLLVAFCAVSATAAVNTICPDYFVGVCCLRRSGYGFVATEVANPCYCTRLGGKVVDSTRCHRPTTAPPMTHPTKPSGPPPPGPGCVCTAIYAPVCCTSYGVTSIAGNACTCRCSGGQVTTPVGGCGIEYPV